MNITFLIGNGFDIHLGLKTSYYDIEKAYVYLKPDEDDYTDDPDIIKFKDSIRDCVYRCSNNNLTSNYIEDSNNIMSAQRDMWSDFEVGMGEYTAFFGDGEEEYNKYEKCMDNFTEFLVKYMLELENTYNPSRCADNIKKIMQTSLVNFYGELNESYRSIINHAIGRTNTDPLFSFISFNYTHFLDELLLMTIEENGIIGSKNYTGANRTNQVSTSVNHIHGELPGPIIMGINDDTQLLNEKWKNNRWFADRYIKSQNNIREGTMRDSRAKSQIENSTIICLYGMSLGKTDKLWWENIGKWLLEQDHQLIIYAYNKALPEIMYTSGPAYRLIDSKREQFISAAGMKFSSDESKYAISQKIHVILNSNIFGINLKNLKIDANAADDKPTIQQNQDETLTIS